MKSILLIVLMLFLSNIVFSQDYPYEVDYYDFINYDSNKLCFYGDSSNFEKLFKKFDRLIKEGEGQISVLQLGASHTQADIFSSQLRGRLQTFYPGMNAGRGYVFPYRMMRTNNPFNYYTKHTGKWSVCRNVERKNCNLGLTGISATTLDSNATIKIVMSKKNQIKYNFNSLKIIHTTDSENYEVTLVNDSMLLWKATYPMFGYTEIFLKEYVEEVEIKLKKTKPTQSYFELYGICLETENQGVVLHPLGVNGAGLYSYTKCVFFEQHLDIFAPDWIIIAIGTNDAYRINFDAVKYKEDYRELINKIRTVNPNIAITMVVPNDCYMRRQPNPNTELQVQMIKELSKEEGCSMWDMYGIMGGYNSSETWNNANLMTSDRIHFTTQGYILLGNLFFNAFMKSYDKHIENNVVPLKKE